MKIIKKLERKHPFRMEKGWYYKYGGFSTTAFRESDSWTRIKSDVVKLNTI